MDRDELQQRIIEVTREIELLSASGRRRERDELQPVRGWRSLAPFILFLVGLLGFTSAYFSLGEGFVAYLFIFGVATPGVLWLMVQATKMPRWSRWRTDEEAIKRLNELILERRRLVKELRQLEVKERGRRVDKPSNGD
ncbi:MAG: hypothetical protein GX058_02610 [Firmicutes bacterium]|nr:hypothetical protein [Bacillota bacterium]